MSVRPHFNSKCINQTSAVEWTTHSFNICWTKDPCLSHIIAVVPTTQNPFFSVSSEYSLLRATAPTWIHPLIQKQRKPETNQRSSTCRFPPCPETQPTSSSSSFSSPALQSSLRFSPPTTLWVPTVAGIRASTTPSGPTTKLSMLGTLSVSCLSY